MNEWMNRDDEMKSSRYDTGHMTQGNSTTKDTLEQKESVIFFAVGIAFPPYPYIAQFAQYVDYSTTVCTEYRP